MTPRELAPPPRPTSAEGWLIDVLLPKTDMVVLVEAIGVLVVFGLLLRPARRASLLQLWFGGLLFTLGLFVLRASH